MLVLGALSVLGGAALALVGIAGGGALASSGDIGTGAGLATLFIIGGIAIAATGIPEIACWVGLSKRRPWGRTLGLFLSAMSLAAFPIGTALGTYGLWVLMSARGVQAFGMQRTWGTDVAAIALGWMFRPDRDDRRRRRQRGRGRRASSGCGLFVFMLLLGAMMFATCGEAFTSCAGALTGDVHRYDHVSPADHARKVYDGMSDGTTTVPDPAPRGAAPAPAPAPIPVPVPVPVAPPAPPAPPAPEEEEKKRAYIYTDKNGTPVIVDDLRKVPDDRKHTLRSP